MSPRRTLQSFAVRRIASGALALACALPVSGQSKTATEAGEQGRGSGRNQTQSQSRPGPAPAPSPTPAPAARPPGAAPSSPRFGGPVPRDARVELPSDARPSVPPDARQPLGQQGLSQKPPRMERWSQGRPSAGSKRVPLPDKAGEEESALERARRIDQDARERHGLDDGDGSSRPDGSHRPRRVYPGGYYRDWGYGPYWNRGYDRPYGEWSGDDWSSDDRGFNQDWERDDWDDWGQPAGGVADVGVGVAGGTGHAGGRADWGAGWDDRDLPLLPPDDLLPERGLSPALKAALDESLEWRQATAELIEAWGAYARAVNRVLAEVRRTPEYRKAREELKRAEAKLGAAQGRGEAQALQARPATPGRAPNPRGAAARADRLFPLADAVFDARQALRSIEQEALGADAQVRAAQRRLDDAVERRNNVREKTEASLPKADRDLRRPTLLEDE